VRSPFYEPFNLDDSVRPIGIWIGLLLNIAFWTLLAFAVAWAVAEGWHHG